MARASLATRRRLQPCRDFGLHARAPGSFGCANRAATSETDAGTGIDRIKAAAASRGQCPTGSSAATSWNPLHTPSTAPDAGPGSSPGRRGNPTQRSPRVQRLTAAAPPCAQPTPFAAVQITAPLLDTTPPPGSTRTAHARAAAPSQEPTRKVWHKHPSCIEPRILPVMACSVSVPQLDRES